MFSKKIRELRRTLALRLTLWYAFVFTACSALAFALVYVLIVSFLQQRIDTDLREDIDEFAQLFQDGGLDRIRAKIAEDTQGDEARETFFRVWTFDAQPVMASSLSAWRGLDTPRAALQRLRAANEPILISHTVARQRYRVRTVYGSIGQGLVLEIGQSMAEDEKFLEALLRGFLVTFGAIVIVVSPIGWFMARRALRGVEDITRTAAEIAQGALDQRVTVRFRGDELDRLAQTFNTMLDRIQALIVGMREMTDNLAHDLRSPLARIRTSAEMRLNEPDAAAAQKALAIGTIEECDRLLDVINTTLDIAEAESGAAKLDIGEVDLVPVVHDACDLFQTVAEDRHITLVMHLPARCRVHGDLQRLQRVLANLLDNALKYTLAGGQVTIALGEDDQSVRLSVADTGIGISADDLPRVFQRFYRCDQSRSQPGNGLGLNLARAFVRAHGGEITVTSAIGNGSTFTVTLKRPPHGPAPRAPRSESSRRTPETVDE